MLSSRIVLGLSAIFALACGSSVTNVDDDGGVGARGGSAGGGGTPNLAPSVSLSVSPATLTEGGSVSFRALVTDPEGDIVAGVLRNEMGTYGAFEQEPDGSYSIAITWNQLNAVAPINFMADTPVIFTAEFSDSANNVGTATTTLTLTCNSCAAVNGACMCGSLCIIDCTTISTPVCLLSVCNEGMYQGVIGECVIVEAPNGTPCPNGTCQSGQCL